MSETFKFDLGDKVKDRVTGFTGIVMARTEWFNGCVRYQLQRDKIGKDGKLPDTEPFDEQQLDLLVHSKIKPARETEARTGGPRKDDKSPVRAARL